MKASGENLLKSLSEIFYVRGSSAVAERIRNDLSFPALLEIYQQISVEKAHHTIHVKSHPHEATAIAFMNMRLHRMGLGALVFKGVKDAAERDLTEMDERTLRMIKWLRYFFGPGVALVATFFSLPHDANFGLKLLPAVAIGATSVALEAQFAWPWLANHVWKRVFKFGGQTFAPITMWIVNFVYLMILYGMGYLTIHSPELFGGSAIPFSLPHFHEALQDSLYWSVLYTLVLGIYQSNIAHEEERGSITANRWYQLETMGVIVVNTARIAKWVLPGTDFWTYLALMIFFLLKTLPQLLKTYAGDRLNDREVFRVIDPKRAPKAGRLERAALALGRSQLVNAPRLQRER